LLIIIFKLINEEDMNSIGLVELSSIASGYQVADKMLKTAQVDLLLSRTICSGKYIVLIGGEVAEVTSSIENGIVIGDAAVIDSFIIPNVHPQVFDALKAITKIDKLESLGIIESFSVSSLIEAADAAVKAARVNLIEIRLAMALGGKAFVSLTGEVEAVTAAVEAGSALVSKRGLLVNSVVIPAPRPELLNEIV
jgi:microcompartment protein CcmL/EutN